MRKLLLVLVVLGSSACAGRSTTAARPTVAPHYACGDLDLVRSGEKLVASEDGVDRPAAATSLGFRDDAGEHFVAFPTAPTDFEAVEYIVPSDPHADAIERVYDTSKGTSRVDWRMTRQRTCRSQGGYTDVLMRWMSGSSLAQVASELSLQGSSEARGLIHEALMRANRRYYADRR